MKVVVLGGAGDMGGEAARDLVQQKNVSRVFIADAEQKKAESLCRELGEKAEYLPLDALAHDRVVATMKQGDITLGFVGPFYRFEVKMVRAAMEARVNYVSVCDDYDAAETCLNMDQEIRRAGITVLSGMGWTPGLSNVLARRGMDTMDRVRRINISWAGGVDDARGLAGIKHTLHIFNGKVPTYQGGKWKKVAAGSEQETIEFPAPIGKLPVFHLGHPEPLTIPHFYKNLEEVTLKGGMAPPWLNQVVRSASRLRMLNTAAKRDNVSGVVHFLSPAFGSAGKGVSGLRVDVHGDIDDLPAHFVYTAVDNMRRLTGIPAAVAAVMIGSGRIRKKGFLAPEIAIKPDVMLQELSLRQVKVNIQENT